MTRSLRATTVERLRQVQAGGVENAKALARVIWELDAETRGMAARELRALLIEQHGVDLREDRINRGRYIARLLYALDPAGDPPTIAHIDDAETLYLLQRLHEVTGTDHAALLLTHTHYVAAGERTPAIRQRMKDALARAQNRTTSDSRASWRQPLMRVPGEMCDRLNRAFSVYAQQQEATQQQAAEALVALLETALAKVPEDVFRQLDTVFVRWCQLVDVDLAEGVLFLTQLLDGVPAENWKDLRVVVLKAS